MVIKPKILGFICTTAHPMGCAQGVEEQIEYVTNQAKFAGPKNVLIIGASTGYGLASRIVSTYGAGAKTIGVSFEREAEGKRTASPGWYNTAAYETYAHRDGYYAKSINGDAFSQEIKARTAKLIRDDLGKVDLVIYSVASPRRKHPQTGEQHNSTLKPIGTTFQGKTVDVFKGVIKDVQIEPATQEEIDNTIMVMGGEDWEMWLDYLHKEKLLADKFTTVAYSYLGPDLTLPIYKNGTIGRAKEHLKKTAEKLNQKYQQARAYVAVNKAVVTQASAAIPMVPLYISLLFKLMKEQGTHEGCIEQMYRLFKDYIYATSVTPTDAEGYVRVDDLEMNPELQAKIKEIWPQITSENLMQLTDLQGYRDEFHRLFGFGMPGINYDADVDPNVKIASIKE